MMRTAAVFLVGLVLGVTAGWCVRGVPPSFENPAPLSCEPPIPRVHQGDSGRISAAAEPSVASAPLGGEAPEATPTLSHPQAVPEGTLRRPDHLATPAGSIAPSERIRWKISAIQRFVPLSGEQRTRLERHFTATVAGEQADESLEEILGPEALSTYREQVNLAFERAAREALEKEVYYVSRKLGLDSQTERALMKAYEEVEAALPRSATSGMSNPAEGARVRQEMRLERARQVLRSDQYEAYAAFLNESSDSDVQIFHGQ